MSVNVLSVTSKELVPVRVLEHQRYIYWFSRKCSLSKYFSTEPGTGNSEAYSLWNEFMVIHRWNAREFNKLALQPSIYLHKNLDSEGSFEVSLWQTHIHDHFLSIFLALRVNFTKLFRQVTITSQLLRSEHEQKSRNSSSLPCKYWYS